MSRSFPSVEPCDAVIALGGPSQSTTQSVREPMPTSDGRVLCVRRTRSSTHGGSNPTPPAPFACDKHGWNGQSWQDGSNASVRGRLRRLCHCEAQTAIRQTFRGSAGYKSIVLRIRRPIRTHACMCIDLIQIRQPLSVAGATYTTLLSTIARASPGGPEIFGYLRLR